MPLAAALVVVSFTTALWYSYLTECIVSIGYCIDRWASMVIAMVAMVEATLLAVAIVVRDYRVNLFHTSPS